MGLFGKVASLVSQFAGSGTINTSNVPDIEPANDFGGTRTTIPKFTQGGGGAFGALPKRTQRELNLDYKSLSNATVEDVMLILADAHPDVSYAVWNFVRIGNGDYTVRVRGVENDEYDEAAELEIRNLIKRLSAPNTMQFEMPRAFEGVLNQLILSTVMRGSCALELVLANGYDDVAFLAPVDTATVDFKYEGERYVPYQNKETLSLDIPTFIYGMLDPYVDSPYGRSPLLGALNMVFFQLQVLADIKAVVHKQGYPRLDVKIVEEVLLKRMPIAIRNNEEKKQKWLNERLIEIINMYKSLDPDDSFVHYDSVEVGMVGGGSGGGALIDPQKLMTAIDNLIMSGLKTLSTILGRRSTGNTESFAKMEIKLYMKGIEAIQKVVADVMSRALTLYLNIKGIQGYVEFRFKPAEIRTDLEKEQFEQIKLMNIAYLRDQGWIDQNEASIRATGSPAVAEPNYEMLGKARAMDTNSDGSKKKSAKDEKPPEDGGGENN